MSKPKIFIAGHKGMVGSALVRHLKRKKVEIITKEKKELNLLDQKKVQAFFKNYKIDQVYLAAAKVGGIHANNTYPAEFIYENLMIQNNVIHSAFLSGVKKLLFLGSSCIYPKNAKQPIKEEELLTGKLELTNEPYALAKIAGIKMCESYNRQFSLSHGIDYRSIMPTNLYGPGDNYHKENSHVIPSLILRFHEAKKNNNDKVIIWGTGKPKREFLYVDDLADAAIFVMNIDYDYYNDLIKKKKCSHINIGSGVDLSIEDLANKIKKLVGFEGKINFDKSKPDGTLKKLLDNSLVKSLGWSYKINLDEGLQKTYLSFNNLYYDNKKNT
jgi:GDP-L-fucose synthase